MLLIICVWVLVEELKIDGLLFDESFLDILFWVIFVNRKELVNIYWLNGKN